MRHQHLFLSDVKHTTTKKAPRSFYFIVFSSHYSFYKHSCGSCRKPRSYSVFTRRSSQPPTTYHVMFGSKLPPTTHHPPNTHKLENMSEGYFLIVYIVGITATILKFLQYLPNVQKRITMESLREFPSLLCKYYIHKKSTDLSPHTQTYHFAIFIYFAFLHGPPFLYL